MSHMSLSMMVASHDAWLCWEWHLCSPYPFPSQWRRREQKSWFAMQAGQDAFQSFVKRRPCRMPLSSWPCYIIFAYIYLYLSPSPQVTDIQAGCRMLSSSRQTTTGLASMTSPPPFQVRVRPCTTFVTCEIHGVQISCVHTLQGSLPYTCSVHAQTQLCLRLCCLRSSASLLHVFEFVSTSIFARLRYQIWVGPASKGNPHAVPSECLVQLWDLCSVLGQIS